MTRNFFKPAMLALAVTLVLASCSKDKEPNPNPTPDPLPTEETTRWITLTAALKQTNDGDGNGGTYAYAVTHDQAIDPGYTVRIFDNGQGFHLKSQRTARVQSSADGAFLYNIQYTGADGGVFNKYKVEGGGKFSEVGNEVNTAIILGTAPRWVKAAEGIGVGVSAGTELVFSGDNVSNYKFDSIKSTMRIATLNLDNPSITNTAEFEFPFSSALRAQGYSVGRIDVPILNESKTKIYIGCAVSKVNPDGTPTVGTSGNPSWPNDGANRTLGTVTLVVDYPSLRNATFIESDLSKINNNSYRTMTQYLGGDGHVYQATATGGSHILRIDKSTNNYDNSYNFDLNAALGAEGVRIQAWSYTGEGKGIVLYSIQGTEGGYLALVNLNDKSASKLATEKESKLEFGQQQGIAVIGDYVYLPLTPVTEDGNVYVINWKTSEVKKGASLVNGTGHRFIGSY